MTEKQSEKINISFIFRNFSKELFVLAILIVAYLPTMLWMWDRWFSRTSYYSHGILVPVVTLFLIWNKKDELVKMTRQPSAWGMRLILLGVVGHVISAVLRIYFTSGFSFLVVLIGLILHFFGVAILRNVLFPVLFLIFMLPLPEQVITNLSINLKLFAAEISTNILNHMRIPAIRSGSIIKMRSAFVVVDDVCSGLRSLISLTALGSIFAYWMKAPNYKRIALFLSTIPIAVITNICRVVFLSSVSEIWGADVASGFLHDLSGYLIFALAFILLFAVGKLLE